MKNPIQSYFEAICSISLNPQQHDFYRKILDAMSSPVIMYSYVDMLEPIGIPSEALRQFDLKPKQCYSNSANVCLFGNQPNIKTREYYKILYCEGYVTVNGLVIDHAWNCIENILTNERTYFDVTFQYVLNYPLSQINKETYCVVQSYTIEDLIKLRLSTRRHGPYLSDIFM